VARRPSPSRRRLQDFSGKYKIEVIMMNEDGEQKDTKSATFTVS